jgi:hypothetical protein
MSHSIKARGLLRHRFHGEYSAVIALGFANGKDASDARIMIGEDSWEIAADPRGLIWQGNSNDLAVVTEQLVSFGAERDKIASVAKSIDFGERFEITIPDVPDDLPRLERGMSSSGFPIRPRC